MKPISQVVQGLARRGVSLTTSGDSFKYRASAGVLSPADLEELKARKPEVWSYLAALEHTARPPVHATTARPVSSLNQEVWGRRFRSSATKLSYEAIAVVEPFPGATAEQLASAVRRLVQKHLVLRSRFTVTAAGLELAYQDASGFSLDIENHASKEAVRQATAGFLAARIEVDAPWLFRARIFVLGSEVVLAMMASHLIFDAGSISIVMEDLERDLLAQQSGEIPDATPPALHFGDFAAWERDWIASAEARPVLDYWRAWARDLPALTAPDGTEPLRWAPGVQAAYRFVLSKNHADRLKAAAAAHRTTVFRLSLATYAHALAQWSGSQTVAIRALGDLRVREPFDGMVGLMICADCLQFFAPPGTRPEDLLEAADLEYASATALRVPLGDLGPGLEFDTLHGSVAATINYVPDAPGKPRPLPPEQPPERLPEPQAWSIPLPPIFLRLVEMGGGLYVQLEFNDVQTPQDAQWRLVQGVYEALMRLAA